VIGLWHLGCVTAASLAKLGMYVVGVAEQEDAAERLNQGKAPLFEPGLDALLMEGIDSGTLRFTSHLEQSVKECEYIWICYDTPVDEDDYADEQFVLDRVKQICPFLRKGQGIILSSQLSVGSTAQLEAFLEKNQQELHVAYSPENLRLGNAIHVFCNPDRIVVGTRSAEDRQYFAPLFEGITNNIIWMSPESAEMTKHAINGFLATSVVFINEIAAICEAVGADAREVSAGMRSDVRIGSRAYLKPGSAFSGGTLARDIQYLIRKASSREIKLPQVLGTKESNDDHKSWTYQTALKMLKDLKGKKIFVLGLTYKAETNTLRRSLSLELIHRLLAQEALVTAYDTHIMTQPEEEMETWSLTRSPLEAIEASDCIIVMTNSPAYEEAGIADAVAGKENAIVIDENGYLINKNFSQSTRYCTVGQGGENKVG